MAHGTCFLCLLISSPMKSVVTSIVLNSKVMSLDENNYLVEKKLII